MTKMMRLSLEHVGGRGRPEKRIGWSYERVDGKCLCVATLADQRADIDERLMRIFTGTLPAITDIHIQRLIVAGYLSHMLELTDRPLADAAEGVRVADINAEVRIKSPAFFVGREKFFAWFSSSFSPANDRDRNILCLVGPKDPLSDFLERATTSWRAMRFNPAGITTDLEYALNYIKSIHE